MIGMAAMLLVACTEEPPPVNVLKPTCANSGCHDGTFEPDYRTLNSAYNTLVYQTPIKNDGNYSFRVEPYNAQGSILMARLRNMVTPSMPIQIEPDSDWPQKKDQYINNIQTWINNGAPGSATNVRLYFAFSHDELMPDQLQYNRISFSDNANAFSGAEQKVLQLLATPRMERGFYGNIVAYTHYIDIDPAADFDAGQEQWYFRVYVQDQQNPVTEIPTDNGIYYIKSYMSFRWAE